MLRTNQLENRFSCATVIIYSSVFVAKWGGEWSTSRIRIFCSCQTDKRDNTWYTPTLLLRHHFHFLCLGYTYYVIINRATLFISFHWLAPRILNVVFGSQVESVIPIQKKNKPVSTHFYLACVLVNRKRRRWCASFVTKSVSYITMSPKWAWRRRHDFGQLDPVHRYRAAMTYGTSHRKVCKLKSTIRLHGWLNE